MWGAFDQYALEEQLGAHLAVGARGRKHGGSLQRLRHRRAGGRSAVRARVCNRSRGRAACAVGRRNTIACGATKALAQRGVLQCTDHTCKCKSVKQAVPNSAQIVTVLALARRSDIDRSSAKSWSLSGLSMTGLSQSVMLSDTYKTCAMLPAWHRKPTPEDLARFTASTARLGRHEARKPTHVPEIACIGLTLDTQTR